MANERFKTMLSLNAYKNKERWEGSEPLQKGLPNWSRKEQVVQQELPPGVYRVAAWQYADGNISVEVSLDTQPPEPQGGNDDFQ
jgi:hypothetical protein